MGGAVGWVVDHSAEISDRDAGSRLDATGERGYLTPALLVLAGGEPGMLAFSTGNKVPGQTVIGRFAAVPSIANPRALVPLDGSRQALSRILAQYAAGAASPMSRLAGKLVALACSAGLAPLVLRSRLGLVAADPETKASPLHRFLSGILGRSDFTISLRLAPGRPNSKPVVQAVAADGSLLAYAKFGLDPLTKRLVRREGEVLAELAPLCSGTVVHIPAVLHRGPWNSLEALVVSPLVGKGLMPRTVREVPAKIAEVVAGLRPRQQARLGTCACWQRMREQAKDCIPALGPQAGNTVARAMDWVEKQWGLETVAIGQSHGDWIPPNISVLADGNCNIWDWERGDADVPLGADTLQFVSFVEMRRPMAGKPLAERVIAAGGEALARQGLPRQQAHMLMAFSLIRSLLWFGEARFEGRTADVDQSFVKALESCMQTSATGQKTVARGGDTQMDATSAPIRGRQLIDKDKTADVN